MEGRTRVMVPENKVGELSVLLASEGVIGPTGTDLEIMSMAANFNVTDSHAKKLYEAQRASDIKAYILQFDKIERCVVILSMGETSAYARPQNTNPAQASIMLTVKGGAMLTNQEAQTIAEAVRGAVPGISYGNIKITDSSLHWYRINDDGTVDPESDANMRIMLENLISKQYQEQGLQILTPIFGMSNVEITVRVGLNFDRAVTESVEYDPPIPGEMEGIVVSSSELWEAQRKNTAAQGVPGTDSNAMGSVEYPYGTLDDNDIYQKRVVDKNFLINETRKLIEHEQGKISSIHIGVMINSESVEEDYTAEITDIISRGMGIPLANVAVQRLPFSYKDTSLEDMYSQWQKYEEQTNQRRLLETIIRYGVILLLGVAFIVLVGMIVRSVRPVPEPVPVLVGSEAGTIDYIAGDDYRGEPEQEYEDVELNKKSSGLEQIERFIDKDPGAVAQLLRNWLTDE